MHERLVAVGSRGVKVRRLGASRAGEIKITRFLRNKAVCIDEMICKSLDLTHRTMSDFAIHPTAEITGEADSPLSMTALGRSEERPSRDGLRRPPQAAAP